MAQKLSIRNMSCINWLRQAVPDRIIYHQHLPAAAAARFHTKAMHDNTPAVAAKVHTPEPAQIESTKV
jgi:hypothetical protein